MKRILRLVGACMAAISILMSATAAEDSASAAGVKVVSDKNPDSSSIEAVLATILKPEMTPQQKGEAIFEYLVKRSYHCPEPEEPLGDALKHRSGFGESSTVIDSMKILNVYGHSICYSISWTVNEFFNAAGLFGRLDGVNNHTVTEIKYDGKWHYFDVDMMGFQRLADNSIPGVEEIKANPGLLNKTAKTPEYFWKYDGGGPGMADCFSEGVKYAMYGRHVSAHSMNLTLRDGESLTRYFQRQWAPNYRFLYPYWPDSGYADTLKGRGGNGPNRPETYYLFKEDGLAYFGNWEMVYEPPLKKASSLSAFYGSTNVEHNNAAPFLRASKNGAPSEVIYYYFSPYGCAGSPVVDRINPTNGAVFEGEFATGKGSLSYSMDLGKSWTQAYQGGGRFKADLTKALMGQYGWLVKLSFEGEGGGISAYKSSVSGQLSPAALPFVDGNTKMTFTRDNIDCLLFNPDITIGESELKRLGEIEGSVTWNDAISGHYSFVGGKGAVIFKVEAPGDIVRVQTGAKFGGRKSSSLNGISFSIDEGKTWTLAAQEVKVMGQEDGKNEEHWTHCIDGILDFTKKKAYSLGVPPVPNAVRSNDFTPKPTHTVWVKVHTEGGDMALIQLYGIYVLYQKSGALPLTITHTWKGGQHVEKIGADVASKTYEVKGGPMDSNESIKIEAISP